MSAPAPTESFFAFTKLFSVIGFHISNRCFWVVLKKPLRTWQSLPKTAPRRSKSCRDGFTEIFCPNQIWGRSTITLIQLPGKSLSCMCWQTNYVSFSLRDEIVASYIEEPVAKNCLPSIALMTQFYERTSAGSSLRKLALYSLQFIIHSNNKDLLLHKECTTLGLQAM